MGKSEIYWRGGECIISMFLRYGNIYQLSNCLILLVVYREPIDIFRNNWS
uniref:Uncharacterized protein n=1 Tax=Human betaherpesvirus 6 TaxID=10368 RepID=A0A1W6LZ52_9BETA|nr:hypothetical protein [Human betaherpesvirus 6]